MVNNEGKEREREERNKERLVPANLPLIHCLMSGNLTVPNHFCPVYCEQTTNL